MSPDHLDDPVLFLLHRLQRSVLRASMAYYMYAFDLGVPQVQILHALGGDTQRLRDTHQQILIRLVQQENLDVRSRHLLPRQHFFD